MNLSDPLKRPVRELVEAECYVPELLQGFITRLEATEHSRDVWRLIVALGRELNLPFIDFIAASNFRDWRKTLFIRTSYDSSWLQGVNDDPDVRRWSYFRSHAMHFLTPIAVGLEFVDEYRQIPKARVAVLKAAAEKGMRSGFSIPLRLYAPPQSALITFSGDLSKRRMIAVIQAHGWTLNTAALMAHQRYAQLFSLEFTERNHITAKQMELIELIGLGLQDKMIADRLGVSVSAVRQRMQTLLANTGLKSRAELAALAMFIGILPHPFNNPVADQETLIEMDTGGVRTRRGNQAVCKKT